MSEIPNGKHTNRSKMWELLNSAYILWAVFFLPFAAFLHIFMKTKYKRYLIFACIYVIPLVLVFINPKNKIFLDIFIFSWLGGIVHCLIERKGYLIRRDIFLEQGMDKADRDNLRQKIKEEMKIAEPYSHPEPADSIKNNDAKILDVNTCSEEEFRSLPGVSVVQAKKAIAYRGMQPFTSVDDFISVAGIQPHFAVNIRPKVTCTPVNKPDDGNRGRMLDF